MAYLSRKPNIEWQKNPKLRKKRFLLGDLPRTTILRVATANHMDLASLETILHRAFPWGGNCPKSQKQASELWDVYVSLDPTEIAIRNHYDAQVKQD